MLSNEEYKRLLLSFKPCTVFTNAPRKTIPTPTKIIHNGPVTVVFWDDHTKTLVRRNENTPDDPYFAFCSALAKKVYGNNSRVKRIISENTVEPKERKDKE